MNIKELERLMFPLFKTIEINLGIQLGSVHTETKFKYCIYTEEKVCGKAIYKDGYCKTHYEQMENCKLYGKKEKKQKLKVADLLNSIITQRKTKVKRHKLGLLEPQTNIMFNDSFHVIGVLRNNELQKLTIFDADKCELYGWIYSMDIVETTEERINKPIDNIIEEIENEDENEDENDNDNENE
jgi:hypothetical protein